MSIDMDKVNKAAAKLHDDYAALDDNIIRYYKPSTSEVSIFDYRVLINGFFKRLLIAYMSETTCPLQIRWAAVGAIYFTPYDSFEINDLSPDQKTAHANLMKEFDNLENLLDKNNLRDAALNLTNSFFPAFSSAAVDYFRSADSSLYAALYKSRPPRKFFYIFRNAILTTFNVLNHGATGKSIFFSNLSDQDIERNRNNYKKSHLEKRNCINPLIFEYIGDVYKSVMSRLWKACPDLSKEQLTAADMRFRKSACLIWHGLGMSDADCCKVLNKIYYNSASRQQVSLTTVRVWRKAFRMEQFADIPLDTLNFVKTQGSDAVDKYISTYNTIIPLFFCVYNFSSASAISQYMYPVAVKCADILFQNIKAKPSTQKADQKPVVHRTPTDFNKMAEKKAGIQNNATQTKAVPQNTASKIIVKKRPEPATDLERLNNMTGLSDLKEQIKAIQDDMELNKLRKTNGIKEVPQSYHMVFSGNPGTGKTTVARLVAGIFYELGILPTNGTVEVKSNDLISEYGTGTSEKTTSVLNDAIGKVLFIDEAYTLSDERDSKNGQEAIDTILKFMEDHQNEFVLIAAGYPDKMNTFLNSNPGLRSRFKRFINFKDYTPDELYSIFADWCTENDRIIEPDAIKKIKDHLTHLYNMRSGYFGNARAAKDYANAVMEAQSKRLNNSGIRNLSRSNLMTITAEDVALSEQPISLEDARRELDELIGIKGVKDKINEMITTVLADRIRTQQGGKPTQIPLHLVFTGNPGTGKTTVARKIAKIYNALGLLPSDHCCEVKRKDLIGPYLGQTEKRTVEWTEKASGGVLFIDEAYTLVNDEKDIYSTAAIDTLMAEMLRGDFAVIAAGYDKEMNEFLASNPGLKSRFKTIIHFDDYTPDEMMQIFEALCRTNNMRITNQAAKNLLYKFSHVNPGDPSFANARGVGNAFNDLLSIQSRRIVKNPTADALLFTEEDVSQYQPPGYF